MDASELTATEIEELLAADASGAMPLLPHARASLKAELDNRAEAAWERQQQSLMESGGPDDSAYRRDMINAGRGHLLR